MIKNYVELLKNEFSGYKAPSLLKDFMAGVTVAAVALPLALAFSVASGADAAAGLITAIVAGLFAGILGGAGYQISGPSGARTAVLLSIIATHQMQGVFVASIIAAIILIVAGLLKLGKLIQFIPRSVVTGFTSGIGIIIALGQIDSFFGTTSVGETAFQQIGSYARLGFTPQWQPLVCALIVVAIMVVFPKKLNSKIPSSLVGLIVSAVVCYLAKFNVPTIGAIPRTLIHSTRLSLSGWSFKMVTELMGPAFTIAALGMIESLLCGVSAQSMTKNVKFDANQELLAQGVSNFIIPFVGGIPSTAAIARTSVVIKSGGKTRLASVFQSLFLIAAMFFAAPIMAEVPLSALAGVLMVTAWRMNEWPQIKYMFNRKMWGPILQFSITMIATVIFDLTAAIIIGVVFSLLLMASRMSKLEVEVSRIDKKPLDEKDTGSAGERTVIVYVSGAMFFANTDILKKKLLSLNSKYDNFVLVLRGVSYLDVTAALAFLEIVESQFQMAKQISFTGVRKNVLKMLTQTGFISKIGAHHFYTSIDKMLLEDPQHPASGLEYEVDEDNLDIAEVAATTKD